MKNFTQAAVMLIMAVCVMAACGHGQLIDPTYIPNGGVSPTSVTDPSGVSIEGGTIVPTKAIFVTFENAVAGGIDVVLVCDGTVVDLVVMPLSEKEFSLFPVEGRFPQMTECELGIAEVGKAYYVMKFKVGCDVLDYFDNAKTLDLAAPSLAYGKGCWKTNLIGVQPANYLMMEEPPGILRIVGATGAEEFEFSKYPVVYKRIGGANYTVQLDFAGLEYLFTDESMADGRDQVQAMIFMADNLSELYVEPLDLHGVYFISYVIRWDSDEGLTYKVQTNILREPLGPGAVYQLADDTIPSIGFIKNGSIVTPYVSFDGGEEKIFFNVLGTATSFDLIEVFMNTNEVDIGIVVEATNDVPLADLFIDSLIITGSDAEFVP